MISLEKPRIMEEMPELLPYAEKFFGIYRPYIVYLPKLIYSRRDEVSNNSWDYYYIWKQGKSFEWFVRLHSHPGELIMYEGTYRAGSGLVISIDPYKKYDKRELADLITLAYKEGRVSKWRIKPGLTWLLSAYLTDAETFLSFPGPEEFKAEMYSDDMTWIECAKIYTLLNSVFAHSELEEIFEIAHGL